MPANPIPEGYHALTPYLVVQGVEKLLEFVQQAFNATVTHCSKRPDGMIMHADVMIGNSHMMMGEAPDPTKVFPCMMYMYVEDTDATYERAIKAGAVSVQPPADQFYGDRNACVTDPVGNQWWFATQKEDLSDEEVQRRAKAQKPQTGP
jgi:uncharacterized glyoxalase superfamily protein PhnB